MDTQESNERQPEQEARKRSKRSNKRLPQSAIAMNASLAAMSMSRNSAMITGMCRPERRLRRFTIPGGVPSVVRVNNPLPMLVPKAQHQALRRTFPMVLGSIR
ncbi:MAG: hypothetical protein HLUCCO16_12975 [Phormidium sp. OSCR]|nr:MAG: hypothetical protein HLUCCO16_12975 [Phormidium sp. OSCR]